MSKIGEPYIKSVKSSIKSKSGLGLGIFIGKTLLEGIDDEDEIKNKEKPINKKDMTRREFFLLFSPVKI